MQEPNNPNKTFSDSPMRYKDVIEQQIESTPVARRRSVQLAVYDNIL